MKKVITYGSFDLFHEGHYRLLQRAKALGDYLIVGITTEHYDESRGKLNVVDSLLTRISNVQNAGFADEIIIEDHLGQKIEDIIKYGVNIFTLGSDWEGQFDYLKDYCEVVYLERTKDISSTMLREQKYSIIRLGIIGTGRIAERFIPESKYVSGITVEGVYNPHSGSAEKFAKEHILKFATDDEEEFYSMIDAVNIASPHETHYLYIKNALLHGKHVLCEKPMVLSSKEAEELYALAREKELVLMEGIKTAYCPGFIQMIGIARSGIIGSIRDVESCFTKLIDSDLRELTDISFGGSFTELASYTLLPIVKLMGEHYKEIYFESIREKNGLDIYTKAHFKFDKGFATSKTGLGVKSDGQLLISGTKGYIRAKAPWWMTKEFEVCYEDVLQNELYETKFLGDGLRYEISDFISAIHGIKKNETRLTEEESVAISKIIEKFLIQEKRGNQ